MSLQARLSAKPRNKELIPSLTIQTEHILQLQTGIEEVGNPSSHTLITPLESSDEGAGKILNPTLPTTGSAQGGAVARSLVSGDFLTVPRCLGLPNSPQASNIGSQFQVQEMQCLERSLVPPGLDFGSQQHLGISIRDFTEPDCATYYEIATPNRVIKPLLGGNEVLNVQLPSLDGPPSYAQAARIRTGIPAAELASRESHPINHVPQDSASSAAVVTASEAPIFGRWPDGSDFSFDGMSASAKKGGFSTDTGQSAADYDDISPTSNVPPRSLSGTPILQRSSPEGTPDSFYSEPDITNVGKTMGSTNDLYNNTLDNSELVDAFLASSTSNERNASEGSAVFPLLPSHTCIPGVPRDMTGELTPPGSKTPSQSNSNGKLRNSKHYSMQTFYRQARTVFLRRRILEFLIGRQLGRPTRAGLRAIAQGLSVNTVDISVTKPDSPQPILT
jgi:hypothetical protein